MKINRVGGYFSEMRSASEEMIAHKIQPQALKAHNLFTEVAA